VRNRSLLTSAVCCTAFILGFSFAGTDSRVNSIGVRLVTVPSGSFLMGSEAETPPDQFLWSSGSAGPFKSPCHLEHGDYDERPVHKVSISRAFRISETEITSEQYRLFDPSFQGSGDPYVSGVSWEDATAFCRWLSRREGKPYRLPTEAEWEYSARAGTRTHFWSGDKPPAPEQANPWGLKNIHTGVVEWCLDWYGPYPDSDQVDPVGPAAGIARVIRGGGIQQQTAPPYNVGLSSYYARSANRGGLLPGYRAQEPVGFRVVQADLPSTPSLTPADPPFAQMCVKQKATHLDAGPDPSVPYFRQRPILSVPPDDVMENEIVPSGLQAGILQHNHCPGLEVMPNGDLLAMYFTSEGYNHGRLDKQCTAGEATPDVAIIATRLRRGSDQWDPPGIFLDVPDINDVTPLLWNDGGVLRLFWGSYLSGIAFSSAVSTDNGAHWTDFRNVVPRDGRSPFDAAQPINSVFRTSDGRLHIACDALGPSSILWSSDDNGATWSDPGGRTGGRHSTCVPLRDGGILCMGGKSSNIDGYMPQSVSKDSGHTWQVSKTMFPALGGNQRPTLIRLASGRLFFATDFQDIQGRRPAAVKENGSFAALSDDEGRTWRLRRIDGVPAKDNTNNQGPPTLGYSVARQAPDEVIHLVTSMVTPAQHYEMNEAWILGGQNPPEPRKNLAAFRSTAEEQRFPNGGIQARWSGGIAEDGRYVLDGAETWFYPDGRKQWEVRYVKGTKTGTETYWSAKGIRLWAWTHDPRGTSEWTQWWPNGNLKARSSWVLGRCNGTATAWDRSGREMGRWTFRDGRMVQ
jgi:formylglycine-generating enzyme required for sulfatase activity